jgi:putative ABC transport system permease protein
MWRAYPVLTAAAVASLALGIGPSAAIFSVLNTLLLTNAPVRDPGGLFSVYATSIANPEPRGISFQNFEHLRESLPFALAAYAPIIVGLAGTSHEPEQLPAELVSENYFRMLGVGAVRGRTFSAGERAEGTSPVVVISDRLWRRRFAASTDAIGEKILINTNPFTIIGVAPAGFASLDVSRSADLWIPSSMHRAVLSGVQSFYFRQRSLGMFDLVARVGAHASLSQLSTALETQARQLALTYPDDNKGLTLSAVPLRESRMPPKRRAAWLRAGTLLSAVIASVLLIACANVANLLLARSASRRHEFALRRAIGASRGHIIAQLITESILLGLAGSVLGLVLGWQSIEWLRALRPPFVPATLEIGIDASTLLFTTRFCLFAASVTRSASILDSGTRTLRS